MTQFTYTVTESGTPLDGALVRVTTDLAGTSTAASGYTDTFGAVVFTLAPGTYYLWTSRAGTNFTNPDTEAVSGTTDTGATDGTPAVSGAYATLPQIKARLGVTDTRYDAILTDVLEAATALVEVETGRVFAPTLDSIRYYTALTDAVRLDDWLEVDEVALDDGSNTYATVLDEADYALEPATPPYRILRLAPSVAFPTTPLGQPWRRGVRVKGTIGSASGTPPLVRELTLLHAMRLFERRQAPLGLSGSADTGMVRISSVDPDIRRLTALLRAKRLV